MTNCDDKNKKNEMLYTNKKQKERKKKLL